MLQAYLNNPKIKEDFITAVKSHKKASWIRQGTYGRKGKNRSGDVVDHSISSLTSLHRKHSGKDRYASCEEALGIPEWLVRLADTTSEGLEVGEWRQPNAKEAKQWLLHFFEAIPVGANLETVKWRFCAYMLSRNIERVQSLVLADEIKKRIVDAIQGVLVLHEQALRTGVWDEATAIVAARAAWSVGESVARMTTWPAALSAAQSAEVAESAGRSAALSVAWSVARSAEAAQLAMESTALPSPWMVAWSAQSAEYKLFADKLLELLEQA